MSIVNNIWLLVEFDTYTMPTEVTYNTIAILLGMLLYSMTDITYKGIRLSCFGTYLKAFLRYTYQTLLLRCCFSNDEHTTCICIIAIYNRSHINIDNITFLKNIFFLWNTMTHNFINTCAYTLRISLIVQAGRDCIVVLAILHTDIINLLCIHSCVDSLSDSIQAACINYTTLSDTFNLLRCLNHITCRNEFALLLKSHYL